MAVACRVFLVQVGVASRQVQRVLTKASASEARFEKSVARGLGCEAVEVEGLVVDVGGLVLGVEHLVVDVGGLGL